MSQFTPWSGLAGGLLIGASAVLLFATVGRLAGISNMAHGLLRGLRVEPFEAWAWRGAFLLGLVSAGTAYFVLTGQTPQSQSSLSSGALVLGGLLVGWGTSQGHGCTSGHGVCGIGRLSVRSIVATLTFMSTAALTVFLVRHVLHVN